MALLLDRELMKAIGVPYLSSAITRRSCLRDAASTVVTQRQRSVNLNSLSIIGLTILLTVLTACGGGTSTGGNSVPPQASLQSIQITGASSSLTVPASTQLSASGKYSDGTTKDLTQSATWSSSDATVAAVVG